jgi:hypothetical protein
LRVGEASSCRTKAEDYANARRLVAAWNACEGYDTEALESEDLMTLFQCRTISKLMDAKTQRDELATQLEAGKTVWRQDQQRITELASQRDELLAALKLIRASEATACSHEYCKGIARAAIQKVEAGQ